MSNRNVKKFFQKLDQDDDLEKQYEQLMADNISLIVIVAFAKQLGCTFTTREFAEYLILQSATKKAAKPVSNIFPFNKKAG